MSFKLTQDDVISTWNDYFNNPIVSISCITYNHEKYIENAIIGFLTQKTTFPFEVLIYDDASTDATSSIIKEYCIRFPLIIKPFIHTKNQYSKGVKVNSKFNFPRAKGHYIALCEGDDYWIDQNKLQSQYEIMISNPSINISFHPSFQLINNKINKNVIYSDYGDKFKTFTVEEVILGDGQFMPTQSLMIKTDILKSMPNWFFLYSPVGDYYFQMISSYPNGALYIPYVMSVYRSDASFSWTSQYFRKNNIKKLIEGHYLSFLNLNKDFDYKYQKELRKVFSIHMYTFSKNASFSVREKLYFLIKFNDFLSRNKYLSILFWSTIPGFFIKSLMKIKETLHKSGS